MAIEIRELHIKVNIREDGKHRQEQVDFETLKQHLMKECRKEIKRELKKSRER